MEGHCQQKTNPLVLHAAKLPGGGTAVFESRREGGRDGSRQWSKRRQVQASAELQR